ncbi:ATP-dependent nuclease [Flaviflexus equikiangi]|uniref:ATP-binding protein n=1 Tax=Flaviflexus equikiangi TaxID=2758573 RepID=A0ABS2TEX5_9ACTO|nr:ATP-binding protein [Flaviflexus equikiangi]MBM9433210.1 ATP-binding protein [Flaviflexus equikiangi]
MIREVKIRKFRGISSLDWLDIPAGVIALVGPGDGCKTTFLDALDVLFHGYWSLSLTENDFFNQNVSEPIVIEATLSPPPSALTEDRQFLSYLRGYDSTAKKVVDEPDHEDPALTLRFTMGSDFEPRWEIVCDRHAEGVRISGEKRRQFGVRRIAADGSALRWGTRSPLRTITDSTDDRLTDTVLREAARTARVNATEGLRSLASTVESIQREARSLRALEPSAGLDAALDADLAGISRGSVSLHTHDLPLSRAGLGTQRLISVAVESVKHSGAHVLLCDELEAGLEPFRTRHLVRHLQSGGQQVFMTTHSPVVIRELDVDCLVLLRKRQGIIGDLVALRPDPDEFQGLFRSHSEALLSRRVVVCEGATEVGFVREICAQLETSDSSRISTAEPVDAAGEKKISGLAIAFSQLGYETGVVCDHDTNLDLSGLPKEIIVARCDKGLCIEAQVLQTATWKGLVAAVKWGVEQRGYETVKSQLQSNRITDEVILAALLDDASVPSEGPSSELIKAVVKAATPKENAWFKRISGGERLAQIALDRQLVNPSTTLVSYMKAIRDWCAPHVEIA